MAFFNRFKKQAPAPPEAAPKPEMHDDPDAASLPAMPSVKEMPVEELKGKLERGERPLLLDVREQWEYNFVHLPQAKLIPMNTIPQHIYELDKNAEIVVHCHHGSRFWNVAAYLLQNGFTDVKNLTGGIDAWARRIDRTMKTY